MTRSSRPRLAWVSTSNLDELRAAGWDVIAFDELVRDVVGPASRARPERGTMATPAAAWLARVGSARNGLAVVGVELPDLPALSVLHGYVLEPAWRAGIALHVESADRLTRLPAERFVDPGFEYPYTLQRALHAATKLFHGDDPLLPNDVPPPVVALDAEQQRAVDGHDGVVQVIAPAGSGKTTVLIERVRELLRRGVPPPQILCTTFNRDAAVEMQGRLAQAGLGQVEARTFHSLGLAIVREERLGRPHTRQLSLAEWKRLCAIGSRETGTWIEAADARTAISDIKLRMLCTPAEFRGRASEIENGETLACVYEAYEQRLAEMKANDFDDQILLAVRALRSDAEIRERRQSAVSQVLVDEYQDIEPAQELLVRILAAPQDGFFCVGDEDQTLYGWRRASVRRMIGLDLDYPGLQRIALAHNYRCPPEVVTASRKLIEHNTIRFPKAIHVAPGRGPDGDGAIRLHEPPTQTKAADAVARNLSGKSRGEIAVLARTTNLLREVALSCVDHGVRISAPPAVFEPRGARAALEAYLRLCSRPSDARPEDVLTVFRAPSRGLPWESEGRVAQLLGEGRSFAETVAALPVRDDRERMRLDTAAGLLTALSRMGDAERLIRHVRTVGGLDAHFSEHEDAFGGTEHVETEVLEQAQKEASGRTVAEYLRILEVRTEALQSIRDDEHGIELTTIHRAKGRQWPRVELFGCDESQLPHRHSFEASEEAKAAGEGLEAERRLAYVAFTRAQRQLVISATEGEASRFLTEAGLSPKRPWQPPVPPPQPPRRHEHPRSDRASRSQPRKVTPNPSQGPVEAGLATAHRVGLTYALRTAPSTRVALLIAAEAIDRRVVGHATTSQNMTVRKLLLAMEHLPSAKRDKIVETADLNAQFRIAGLEIRQARALERALRDAAAGA